MISNDNIWGILNEYGKHHLIDSYIYAKLCLPQNHQITHIGVISNQVYWCSKHGDNATLKFGYSGWEIMELFHTLYIVCDEMLTNIDMTKYDSMVDRLSSDITMALLSLPDDHEIIGIYINRKSDKICWICESSDLTMKSMFFEESNWKPTDINEFNIRPQESIYYIYPNQLPDWSKLNE